MDTPIKRPVGRPRKTPAATAPAKPRGDGLRRAALKAGMLAADATTQALRRLFPLFNKLKITQEALNKAMGRG